MLRSVILAGLCLHVFLMYSFARTGSEEFGFDPANTMVAVIFAVIMMVPFCWAFGIADLPQIYVDYWRPTHRWKRGRCPACGYDLQGSPTEQCSECGKDNQPPQQYSIGWSTIRRFILLVIVSTLIGCATAEATIVLDEYDFRRTVQRLQAKSNDATVRRVRRWPNGQFTLTFSPDEGFRASR